MSNSRDSEDSPARRAVMEWYESVEADRAGGGPHEPVDRPERVVASRQREENGQKADREPPQIRTAFSALIRALGHSLRSGFQRPPGNRAGVRRRIGWLGGFFVAAGVWLVVVAGVLGWALRDVPWQQILDGSLEPVVVIEDSAGQSLVQAGPFQGAYADLKEFPPHLIDAVVSIEDRRFFSHHGIDLRGMLRALLRNVSAGQITEGGSTITQQLVKVLYLESDRTYRRKIQEVVVSFWLESRLSKEEILARYLNSIYLGAGATGVPAAARVYFDKDVAELDLSESVMIAGLIRAPSQLNPLNNPDGARQRATVVLQSMHASGVIATADAAAVQLDMDRLNPNGRKTQSGSWFTDWAMEEARQIAGPYRGTIRFRTTLVPELQEIAERAVGDLMEEHGESADASQAALVALAPDGAVLAMTGGLDYRQSSFNRAVHGMRQPGSTFKLFVYYAALRSGLSPMDMVDDAPIEVAGWAPENFGGGFHGRVTLAEAFARSLNAATVHVAEAVGIDKVAEAARELGIDADLTETPSLALGTSEVSLLDLTGAYASIRAGVAPIEPWGIESFQAGEEGRPFRVGPTRRPQIDLGDVHRPMVDMLRLVVERGTGTRAAIDGFAAGKTGTSQNFRDAWFVGFTQNLVVGVWVGNDDGSPMNRVTGGGLPSQIWQRFASEAEAVVAGDEMNVAADVQTTSTGEPDTLVVGGIGQAADRSDPHRLLIGDASGEGAARAPACDVQACSRRYRSFRASDCTFQPYRGPRRQCDIGQPDASFTEASAATESGDVAGNADRTRGRSFIAAGPQSSRSAPAGCNVQACSRAYRSFRVSDCTYQPYRGPRRLCTH